MAYALIKNGVTTSNEKQEVFTIPERHGAVLTLSMTLATGTISASVNIYVRTEGGQDDVPIHMNVPLSVGTSTQIKALYIHGKQTLVIESAQPVDWSCSGFGDLSATANNLPQGRMFNLRAYKSTSSEYLVLEIPGFGSSATDFCEGDFFLNSSSVTPVVVDVKVSNTFPTAPAHFDQATWLFSTVVKNGEQTKVFRKMCFGMKYVIFRAGLNSDVSAFLQYNLRWGNLT